MADVISVGAIGDRYILIYDPLDNKSDGNRHKLLCPYLDLR